MIAIFYRINRFHRVYGNIRTAVSRKSASKQSKKKAIRKKENTSFFIDKDHAVMEDYYEIMEKDLSNRTLLKKMRALIKIDPDFYDPYLIAVDILFDEGKNEEANTLLKEAYDRTLATISDSTEKWPNAMEWGWLQNRHIMRTIERYATELWDCGKIEESLDIFRRLLRANPNDNQGMRYNILAIRMGLSSDEWQEPFLYKSKGRIIGLDAIQVSKWFNKNAKKFSDEFWG